MKDPLIPVLLQSVTMYLAPKSGRNFVDATLGFGGHAEAILKLSAPNGRLIGIDQDIDALAYATKRLKPYSERFSAYHGNFTEIENCPLNSFFTGDFSRLCARPSPASFVCFKSSSPLACILIFTTRWSFLLLVFFTKPARCIRDNCAEALCCCRKV